MNTNYKSLTENIKTRSNPDRRVLTTKFATELASISYSDVMVYIRYAMKGVSAEYTQVSIDAGENAKKHLSVLRDVTFKFQGSVMTNTHIRAHSDIDLLAISTKFYSWDPTNVDKYIDDNNYRSSLTTDQLQKLIFERQYFSAYTGDSLADLRQLRLNSEVILKSKYSICNVIPPKCIEITNQDLRRDVDIVIANWYDDVSSIIYSKGDNRGIQVYNKDTHAKGNADFPFVSIVKINERSTVTAGRLKKMIRFIKNVKADSTAEIDLNSFDINAICYDIPVWKYQNLHFADLVPVIYTQLESICTNKEHADKIISVDGREYIFKYNNEKLENVKKILNEVRAIYLDLKQANQFA